MKQAMVQLQPLSQLIDETVENELNRYFNDHDARNYVYDERGDFDPLKTWKHMTSTYPRVARIARDILSIPGTSLHNLTL
jgi:hypothetical protein